MNSKKLTVPELYWYIIGAAIGSGLFVLLPYAIGAAGKAAALSVPVGTIITIFSFLYFFVVSSLFPLKGGDYSQVAFLTPPLISGVYGYMWLTSGLTLTAYGTGCIEYASAVFPALAPHTKLIAFVLITFFFAINYFGAKSGAKVQGFMTVTLLLALAMFIVMGLPKVDWNAFVHEGEFFMNGFSGFSASLGLTVFVTMGVTTTASALASEVNKPTKTIPKHGFMGQLLVSLICTLIVIVACGVLPIEQVADKDLTLAAAAIFPKPLWIFFIFGGAVFALLTSLFGNLTAFMYPFLQLAEEGWIPKAFLKKTKNGWPYVAMLTIYVLTLIPLFFDITFDRIASATSIPSTLVLLYVSTQCFKLPNKYPEQWKKSILHMPMSLYYIICSLSVCANLYMVYCYASSLTRGDIIFTAVATAAVVIVCYLTIKTKHVDPEYLKAQKEAIEKEIAEYAETEKNN